MPELSGRQASTHQEPDHETAHTNALHELSPGQSVGIKTKDSHHAIKNLLVLANQEWTVGGIELLNLLQLDFTQLCHRAVCCIINSTLVPSHTPPAPGPPALRLDSPTLLRPPVVRPSVMKPTAFEDNFGLISGI